MWEVFLKFPFKVKVIENLLSGIEGSFWANKCKGVFS